MGEIIEFAPHFSKLGKKFEDKETSHLISYFRYGKRLVHYDK